MNDRITSGDRANGGSTGPEGPVAAAGKPGEIEVRQISIGGQSLQVAIRHGAGNRPPLLLFNGIGANWELAKPFLEALTHTTAIIFDVPGVGGSPAPSLPYRPSTLARLAAGLVAELGYSEIDVAGVSWGGGVAQQFAHQYPKLCRRLVLAATSPGAIMVPAGPSVLWKMATPRRYTDKDYMRKVAPEIYGGDFRKNPSLIDAHARAMRGTRNRGYLYQLLAMTGWTSLPWLWSLRQPTLILMGSDDPLVPSINGRILALLIPNAQLRMIDDGHLFMVTRPAETAAIIEAFLAEGKNEPAQTSYAGGRLAQAFSFARQAAHIHEPGPVMRHPGAEKETKQGACQKREEQMASPQTALAEQPAYSPPPIDGDFYRIANVLDEGERALIKRVRAFAEGVVAPVIEEYWARDEFPFEIIPKMAEVGIGGVGYEGYGAAGGNWLLNGFVAMELARVEFVGRDFLGRAYRPFGGVDLPVRRRGAETALAACHDALREDRLVRADRTAGRLGDVGRNDDDLPARGRHMGPQRPEEMDRQRYLRRHQCDLGARRGLQPGQGLRRREG